jgi:hypothetical protein
MISPRIWFVAPATLALSLALAGCGRSAKEQLAADYCPTPFSVHDAQTLTRFRPGAGQDPRNVVFDSALLNAASTCSLGKNQMKVNLVLLVAATPGPAIGSGVVNVPYFVRVLDASNTIVQGREFTADFKMSANGPRRVSKEELTLELPFAKPADAASYRIAVGLKPTQEELDYNRRSNGAH